MFGHRPLLLLLLLLYIFAPSIIAWVIAEDGHWLRPFFVWLLVIMTAFAIQFQRGQDDV